MFTSLNYILWNPSETIFSIGNWGMRWYSLCWLLGLALAYITIKQLYKQQRIKNELFEPLFIYAFIGILVGARLGHCLFYEPSYYLSSWKGVFEMLLPIKFNVENNWHFTGYEGLASHGGTIGLAIAIILYSRKTKLSVWTVLDNIAIVTPITAFFIRLGNLFNSEIIGNITNVPWAFIFERVDSHPRHPGQLYEAICYLIFFFVGFYIYKRNKSKVGTGLFFGICLSLIFTARFFIEFVKTNQVDFEQGMFINMGQILSIPFILIGFYCVYRGIKINR